MIRRATISASRTGLDTAFRRVVFDSLPKAEQRLIEHDAAVAVQVEASHYARGLRAAPTHTRVRTLQAGVRGIIGKARLRHRRHAVITVQVHKQLLGSVGEALPATTVADNPQLCNVGLAEVLRACAVPGNLVVAPQV